MTGPVAKPYILAIAPYIPGRSTTDDGRKVAKLSSNENPLGTSPAARAAFAAAAHTLERYPDASGTELREALAAKHGPRSRADHLRQRLGTRVLHLAGRRVRGRRRRGHLRPLRLLGLPDRDPAGRRDPGGRA